METINIFDENKQHIGIASREDAHTNGLWHQTFHCWIYSPDYGGCLLFQKRGKGKNLFPNMLDITAAGHLEASEIPEDGVREIQEELGIEVSPDMLRYLGTKFDIAKVGNIINREFSEVYLLRWDNPVAEIKPDPSEVEGLVRIGIQDGLDLFSGRKNSAIAEGIEWNSETSCWESVRMEVDETSFIPRVDPYYYKAFIAAQLSLSGAQDVAI